MLEAAIILQIGLGDYVEAGVVAFLLIFNAALKSWMSPTTTSYTTMTTRRVRASPAEPSRKSSASSKEPAPDCHANKR